MAWPRRCRYQLSQTLWGSRGRSEKVLPWGAAAIGDMGPPGKRQQAALGPLQELVAYAMSVDDLASSAPTMSSHLSCAGVRSHSAHCRRDSLSADMAPDFSILRSAFAAHPFYRGPRGSSGPPVE